MFIFTRLVSCVMIFSFVCNATAKVYAQDSSIAATNECKKHYQRKISKRVGIHQTISENFTITAATATAFAFINPIVSAVILGIHYGGMLFSSHHGSEQGNVFNLHYLDTEEGKNLFKDVTQLDPDISNVDIHRIIEDGFKNNIFCKDLPKLMTLDEIRDYVRDVVKQKSEVKSTRREERAEEASLTIELDEITTATTEN